MVFLSILVDLSVSASMVIDGGFPESGDFVFSSQLSRRSAMKDKILGITGILILSLTMGCGTMGNNFDTSQVRTIQNGVTTQVDILDRFGPPFKEGVENGRVMWTYQFDVWSLIDTTKSKDLVILFDDRRIVRAHRYTTSGHE